MLRRFLFVALALSALGATKLPNETPPPPVRNHLGGSSSRYLLEHASNAVDWYSWGPAAFAKAKSEDKPIFLSIGYASCHWCHVMSRESFQDPAISEFINANFVSILVDRDEHPDVDATYMAFVAAMNNGNAGWPANLVITSDLSPITGTSYLSSDALRKALGALAEKWRTDRASLMRGGAMMLAAARESAQESSPLDAVSPRVGSALVQRLRAWNDRENGGFGAVPKFPHPLYIDFLLRRAQAGEDSSRDIAVAALNAMALGAIHDQVGGGFHRYTVDAAWRTPHFEKLLTDQALMSMVYLEAWQITKNDAYARVARRALDYAIRSLRLKNGAFGIGEDADSLLPAGGPALIEGAHYVWNRDEVMRLLGKQADVVAYYFGITAPEKNILYVAHPDEMTRKQFAMSRDAFAKTLDDALAKMLLVRSHRPAPMLDDAVVVSWNGLMISALARAGAALDDPHYLAVAGEAARTIDGTFWDAKAKRMSRARSVEALAEDYAFMIQADLDLFDATGSTRWLTRAIELQQKQDELFWSGTTLRYDDGSTLPAALRAATLERDGDVPAANSVSASNLLRIAAITDSKPARAKADAIFRSFAARMQESPGDLPLLISTFSAGLQPPSEVVIVGDVTRDDTKAMMRLVHERFAPLRVLLVVANERSRAELSAFAPWISEMKARDEKLPTAYVCENYSCKPPTTNVQKLDGLLTP
jgi:uncharacterized protein YyaL (SSP411 family)